MVSVLEDTCENLPLLLPSFLAYFYYISVHSAILDSNGQFIFFRYCCVSFPCIFSVYFFENCLLLCVLQLKSETETFCILKDKKEKNKNKKRNSVKFFNRKIARPLFISLRPILFYYFFQTPYTNYFNYLNVKKMKIIYIGNVIMIFNYKTNEFFLFASVESIFNLFISSSFLSD